MKSKDEIQEEKEYWKKKDLEFEEYSARISKIMWRGIGVFGLIVFVAVLIWGIVSK